ncbi:MAG: DNA polymerase-3 subunit chi [Myxococcota bacterium]|jgi:DNA polymerase-3 subunit chi
MNPRVTFYDVAPDARLALVSKLADAAWRRSKPMLIHTADPAEAKAVDNHLWTFREEAFVPHEIAGEGPLSDPEAKIVIVTQESRPIEASILVQLTPVSPAFAQVFAAIIDIVDHRDDTRLTASRERFKAWRALGVTPTYKKSV